MEKTLTDYNLLIVSDLHLSEGRDGKSRKFSKNEDFFFGEEFARFLAYYQDARRWNSAKWHLIINGDFLDFLQVITADGASSPRPTGSDHHALGLPCGEQETVRKLGKIAKGHRLFFESLAGFVAAGNLLTIVKGNHDVEFHYHGVRAAFLAELQGAFKRRLDRDPDWGNDRAIGNVDTDTVRFSDWYYFEQDLLWVEHGNRYEGFNSFKYWLSPLLPEIPGWPLERKDEIDLPFGSLFVRYLFNRIEGVEPFADNIKPATRFVWWLIRKHPITALSFIFKDGRYMLGRIRRAWTDVPPEAWDVRKRQHNARLGELAIQSGIEFSKLEQLDGLRERSVLKEPNFRAKVLRTILRPWILLPGIALAVAAVLLAAFFVAANLLANVIPDFVRVILLDPFVDFVLPVAPWTVLLVALAGLALFLRWLLTKEERQEPSYLKNRAACISELLGVQYVIMGHTHDAELYNLGVEGGRKKEYFNTGTWTTVFSEEERLIRKPVEFVFLQGLRGEDGFTLKLLEWNDGAYEPRLLELFRDEKNAGYRKGIPPTRAGT
jgi:UDP-2,3-diacylglucosamine pyrophosphatase LpxH